MLPHGLTKSSALTLQSLQFTEQQGRHISKSHCYVQIGTLLRYGWTPMMRQSIYYNSEHCFLWPLPKENKAKLTVWWVSTGIIHYHFLKTNETIMTVKCCEEIDTMHPKFSVKQPILVNRKGPIF